MVRTLGKSDVPARSDADDLNEFDRSWAELVATLQGIPTPDAEKRIRRIRYDPKLNEKFMQMQAQLGASAVITNVEWSGPEMRDITVSVAPAPVLVDGDSGTQSINPEQARARMRARVMSIELGKMFPRSGRAVLPGMIAAGIVPLYTIDLGENKFALSLVRP